MTESNKYFSSNDYLPADFQKNCNEHINKTKNSLRQNQGLAVILGKILLAVATFGLIPIFSTLKSKYYTGTYQCRFFDPTGEREVDDVSRLIGAINPSKA